MMFITFWAVVVLILVYAAFLIWIRLGFKKLEPGETHQAFTPPVSIIVAARNEALNVPGLLTALHRQSYPADRTEIIVADDGSTDDTLLILQLQARKMENLHPIHIDQSPAGWGPKKWALAQAIRQAKGDIILTTDADCVPGPLWVETMVGHFVDSSIGMVIGPSPMVSERRNLVGEGLLLDSCAIDALAAGSAGRGLALTCTGRNMAYRRETFDEVEGFKGVEHFVSGDDDLLMHKISATGNWQIIFAFDAAATVASPPPPTLGAFVRQRLRFASKGRYYFGMDTGPWFKLILPFLYLTNLAVLISLAVFAIILAPLWLVPVAVKIAAEALLVIPYLRRIERPVRAGTFIITGLVHPIYVALFGALGNLRKLTWKGRRFEGPQVSA